MATIKTRELSGAALDYAVYLCEEEELTQPDLGLLRCSFGYGDYKPSIRWRQGGPIIEREMDKHGFDLWSGAHVPAGQFAATYCRGVPDSYMYGPTLLITAMRCYVESKIGDSVEIPDSLI